MPIVVYVKAGDGLRARAVYPLLLQSVRACGATLKTLVLDGFRLTDAELHLTMIKLPRATACLQKLSLRDNEFGTSSSGPIVSA